MADLVITVTGVTYVPSLRCWVAFTDTRTGPYTYTVTCTSAGHSTVTATGTSSPIWVSTPLDWGTTYSVKVAADGEDHTISSTVTGTFSRSQILRQQIADLIRAGSVTDAGSRALTILADSYYQPRCLRESDAIAQNCPFLELLHPRLTATKWVSGIRAVEQYSIRMRIMDAGQDEDTAVERVMLLADKMRNVLDATDSLSTIGIVDNAWAWSYDEPIIDDRLTSMEIILTVQVQAIAGYLPYSA